METDFNIVVQVFQGGTLMAYLFIICKHYVILTLIDLNKKEKKMALYIYI